MNSVTLSVPKVKVEEHAVKFSIPGHFFFIDIELDMLFLDGDRMKTTKFLHQYDKFYCKPGNSDIPKKRLAKFYGQDGSVLVVNCGFDGRLFFLWWSSRYKFHSYRMKPDWQASYWHDRREKEKRWYENDLSEPKKIWRQENGQINGETNN